MDVTPHFLALAAAAEGAVEGRAAPAARPPPARSSSGSGFLTQTHDMVLQIGLQRDALERVYEDYIDYHCHFRIGADEEAISNHLDRAKVTNDVTAFITNAIDRVNMIRKLLDDDLDDDTPSQRRKHYTEIIKNIFDLLSKLTKMNQKMQSERAKVMRNPFTLISDELSSSSSFGSHSTASAPVTITSDVKSIASIVSKKSKHEPLDEDFSRLYTDQLSKTIRFDKYNNLTEKYKLLLHHESRINKKKFSQELQEARRLEETAGGISGLLSDFVCLLQEQAGQVEALSEEARGTVEQVQAADSELILTIARSNSKQRYMNGFVVGVALLLLLLDFVTP